MAEESPTSPGDRKRVSFSITPPDDDEENRKKFVLSINTAPEAEVKSADEDQGFEGNDSSNITFSDLADTDEQQSATSSIDKKKISFASASLPPSFTQSAPADLDRPGMAHSLTARSIERSARHVKLPGTHMDLATGAQCTRCKSIRPVGMHDQLAMKHGLRSRFNSGVQSDGGDFRQGRRFFRQSSSAGLLGNLIGFRDEPENDAPVIKQYRITSKPFDDSCDDTLMKKGNHCWKSVQLGEDQFQYFSKILHWTFRAGFFRVFLACFIFSMVLVTSFSILIFWIDRLQPECIVGVDRTAYKHIPFGDAYQLSWSTISTVGYGVTGPGLPSTTVNHSRCTGLHMLMAFESFVGMLFGGLTGAIIFAKIARIQSVAPVSFSDPIVVRYGSGCEQHKEIDNSTELDTSDLNDNPDDSEIPCPILEFRLVNNMWNQKGGEIMDASMMLVVSRLETSEGDKHVARRKKKHKGKGRAKKSQLKKKKPSLTGVARAVMANGTFAQRVNHSATSSAVALANAAMPTVTEHVEEKHEPQEGTEDGHQPFNRAQKEAEVQQQKLEAMVREEVKHRMSMVADVIGVPEMNKEVTVDEGADDDKLAPRRIFHTLGVETDSHPFFRLAWNIRHICDENSPLLPNKVRAMIAANNGFWPPQLNNYDAVRKAVNFHEIIVSFTGTANVSGSSVYTQKVYNYVDMTVGYTFVNVLAKDKDGKLYVDTDLLNDVKEQWGGGAEPIQLKDLPTFTGYSSLGPGDSAESQHETKGDDLV
ncbi:hypothetical protein ACA910_010514 [Epithemia clementina (nom. ined.)]